MKHIELKVSQVITDSNSQYILILLWTVFVVSSILALRSAKFEDWPNTTDPFFLQRYLECLELRLNCLKLFVFHPLVDANLSPVRIGFGTDQRFNLYTIGSSSWW